MKVLWVYSFICSRHGGAKKVKLLHVLYVNRSYRKGSKLIKKKLKKGSQYDH